MKPLILLPARNETASLPPLLAEIRSCCPGAELLVVDDASTDDTPEQLSRLGVEHLRLRQHLGVGGAVRAGLRAAHRRGFDVVVRLDADGQHPPAAVASLLAPVLSGSADAVQGCRSTGDPGFRPGPLVRAGRRLFAVLLTRLAGHPVRDPTSGFWAFGPRAVRLLAEHHPTGYPEPELLLLLAANGLRVCELPVGMRPRLAGRSSLTLARTLHALWRASMAAIVVPLRAPEAVSSDG